MTVALHGGETGPEDRVVIPVGCRRLRRGYRGLSLGIISTQPAITKGVITSLARPLVPERFEDVVMPHLDAAYRLARWLMRNEHDAEDVVQEASLRAFQYFRSYAGRNGRAWFLTIVRNTCTSWHGQRMKAPTDLFDEEQHSGAQLTTDPEALLLRAANASLIEEALTDVPDSFRELLRLREVEGLSYQELSDVLDIPIGTVMSGLSRGRRSFRKALEVRWIRSDRCVTKTSS